jgi:hypothetical protein
VRPRRPPPRSRCGEQRAEQPDLLLGDLLGQPSHGLHQGLPQITGPGRGDQHGLAGVAPVDRGFAHTGFGRDRLDGQLVVSDLDQQLHCRVEDRQGSGSNLDLVHPPAGASGLSIPAVVVRRVVEGARSGGRSDTEDTLP